MRILVADDGGAVGHDAIAFLASWGHEVQVASDGLTALRRARALPPDLVVAPARLGRMGAVSLLAALRAGGLRRTAFVLVARPEDDSARERAHLLGATAVLDAPLALADLARVADRVAAEAGLAAVPSSGSPA